MTQGALDLVETPILRRRGRPPGARSKRSLDLARYVEAQFGGMTPGQQTAALCLVTVKELKAAKGSMFEAMVIKASELALALGCEKRDAWLLLQKEREGLMPYVHQRQAQAVDAKTAAKPATVFIVPEGPEQADAVAMLAFAAGEDPPIEFVDDFRRTDLEVGHTKSDDEP